MQVPIIRFDCDRVPAQRPMIPEPRPRTEICPIKPPTPRPGKDFPFPVETPPLELPLKSPVVNFPPSQYPITG